MFGITFGETLTIIIALGALCWAIKEVYEMVTVRKLWQRFFDDNEFRKGIFAETLEPLTEKVINDLPKSLPVLINRIRTDPEFEKEIYTFSNSLFLNAYYQIKERTKAEVQEFMDQGGMSGSPIPPSNIKYPKGHMLKPYEAEVNMIADEIKREQWEKRQKNKGGGNPETKEADLDLAFH